MLDRDKAISRLQIIRTWAEVGKNNNGIQGEGCLRDVVDWIDDALELLKAQEPRVLTLEELRTYPKEKFLVWMERTYAEGEETGLAPIEITGVGTKGVSHYFGSHDFASYNHKCFGWRCWSYRPTDEQREAVSWTE